MTRKEVTNLSYEIMRYAIKVHKTLGPGLIESVYQNCLTYELEMNGHHVLQELSVPIIYDQMKIYTNLKLDLLVDDCVVLELKTVENLLPVHEAQLITYMHLLQKPQGLLINFFTDNLSKSYRPLVNQFFRALPEE